MSAPAPPVPDAPDLTVADVRVSTLRVPLTRPWGPDVTSVGVVPVEVELSDGTVGHGFGWTPQIGLEAVAALLVHDLAPAAVGMPADLGTLGADGGTWDRLWRHLHEAGGGGVTTVGLAALDLALWDAAATRRGAPVSALVAEHLGPLAVHRERLATYGSGVNLHYPLPELLAQVERWVAAGHRAVKVKVGSPRLADDLERVAAVREVLGPDRDLMVDANQRWDLDAATRAVQALAEHRPRWVEEPLRAEDLAGHVELHRRTGAPLAVGENLHTTHRFAEYLATGAVAVVQPNAVRVGGITPFLRVAALAHRAGTALHPHLLPELSGQLALPLPGDPLVEDVEDAGFGSLGALTGDSPVRIEGGHLVQVPHTGLGLRFRSTPALDMPAPPAISP